MVVSHGEGEAYQKAYPSAKIIEATENITNYSQKFQWILDGLPITYETKFNYADKNEKAVIIDDDLVFSSKVDGKLISIKDPELLGPMWQQIEDMLDEFALVGVHPRQMGQDAKQPHVINGRIICLQGVNRAKIGHVKVDQFPILADVILNCTLLARGQANAILTTFFQDHGPCQAPGGCSVYRTPEMQRSAVEYLAGRFPDYVQVVHKVNKAANWLGDEGRYDYRCQWKRLYAAGTAPVLDPGTVPNPDAEAGRAEQTVE